jgi:hypothetical protein
MRIYGPNGAVSVGNSAGSSARRTSGAGFSLPADAEESRGTTSSAPARQLGGIDALIALQGVEDPTERRRRAVKKGFRALDALDELKIGLLAGTLNPATLLRLKAAAGDMKTESGDSQLDQVLAEIDLRVEVELAKAGIK